MSIVAERFQIKQTPITGLVVIERKPKLDSRGFLERFFCNDELKDILQERSIEQINHTLTKNKGTVRGMHLQKAPYAEMKFVSCLRGEVFDVAVDLRPNSATYGHWYSEVLSETNFKTMVIPEGFAHGFQTLTDNCELMYLHSARYSAESEAGVRAADIALNIAWPLPITDQSDRDLLLPFLRDYKI